MSYFPAKQSDLLELIDQSFRCYGLIFKKALPFAFFLTVAQGLIVYCSKLFQVGGAVIFLFFLGALVYQMHAVLSGRKIMLQEVCRIMLQCAVSFYGVILISMLLLGAYYYFIVHVLQHFGVLGQNANPLKGFVSFAILVLVPIMVAIVFFLFTLPLIILERLSPFKAFAHSYQLVGPHWFRAFTIYAAFAIIAVLVSPATLHGQFFMRHHLLLLFDFIIYWSLLPLVFNYLLFMLHDLKLRLS